MKGVPMEISRETCTACAGSMILEMAALSRLTGEPIFEVKYSSDIHRIRVSSVTIATTRIDFLGKGAKGYGRFMANETSWYRLDGISFKRKFWRLGAKRFRCRCWHRFLLRILSQGIYFTR